MKISKTPPTRQQRRPARRRTSEPDSLDLARLERSILGGIEVEPSLFSVAVNQGLRTEHFSLSAHRAIFDAMWRISERHDGLTLPAIVGELERRRLLEIVGNETYVAGLCDGVVAVPSSLKHDVDALVERKGLRDFSHTMAQLAERSSRPGVCLAEVLGSAKKAVLQLERMNGHKDGHRAAVPDGAMLLSDIGRYVDRYVVLKPAQRDVLAIFVLHTHSFDAAEATAFIEVVSVEKRSGKTRLLECMTRLVRKPWLTARVSAAVLSRKIDAEEPTLLLDESDTAFKSDKDYAEALKGILNSGHRRGGVTSLCVGKGAEMTYKDFRTFSPKIIAGIGQLPDTISDRSVPIHLKRKGPDERDVERFRFRTAEAQAAPLREAAAAWAEAHVDALRGAEPSLPDTLNDRQQDGAEPLLAIADLIGGVWPQRARAALVEVCCGAASDDSLRVQLLTDIAAIFRDRDDEATRTESARPTYLRSEDLKNALLEIETSPWSEWNHGKGMTTTSLARLLKPFEIHPKTIRIATTTAKGYERSQFADAWHRYLPRTAASPLIPPITAVTPSQSSIHAGPVHFSTRNTEAFVTGQKSEESPVSMRVVTGVTGQILGCGATAGTEQEQTTLFEQPVSVETRPQPSTATGTGPVPTQEKKEQPDLAEISL